MTNHPTQVPPAEAEAEAPDGDEPASDAAAATPTACPNCGAALTGPYCAQCGQSAKIHRTLLGLIDELTHSIWHLDARIWRTLPLLVWRPGRLTHDYIRGKRAHYVSPLTLFLFCVFAMFLMFEAVAGMSGAGQAPSDPEAVEAGRSQRAEILESVAAGMRENADRSQNEIEAQNSDTVADTLEEAARQVREGSAGEDAPPAINTGSTLADNSLRRAFENPELTRYRVLNAVGRYSFLLVPISLPFIWLIFAWKRGVNLFDHSVFILYSLCFMMLLLMAVTLLGRIPHMAGVFVHALWIAPPVHIYAQLKGTYSLGWVSALWRTVAVLISALLALTVFGGVVLFVGAVL